VRFEARLDPAHNTADATHSSGTNAYPSLGAEPFSRANHSDRDARRARDDLPDGGGPGDEQTATPPNSGERGLPTQARVLGVLEVRVRAC
jgi:hypothetical protein